MCDPNHTPWLQELVEATAHEILVERHPDACINGIPDEPPTSQDPRFHYKWFSHEPDKTLTERFHQDQVSLRDVLVRLMGDRP